MTLDERIATAKKIGLKWNKEQYDNHISFYRKMCEIQKISDEFIDEIILTYEENAEIVLRIDDEYNKKSNAIGDGYITESESKRLDRWSKLDYKIFE